MWNYQVATELREAQLDNNMTEVEELKETIKTLREELTQAYSNNHERNLQLDALKFVWCDGSCSTGAHRWQDKKPTEEELFEIVKNTNRLISWYINQYCRVGNDAQRKAGCGTPEAKIIHKELNESIEKFKARLSKSII